MNKLYLIPLILIVVVISAVLTSPAYPGGYNTDQEVTATLPHGDYTLTGNKCKSCHAVHQGETSTAPNYRLLRPGAYNAMTACLYCHGPSGIATKKVWLDENGHGLSAEQTGEIVAPDDVTYTAFRNDTWGCIACHSPHAANVVTLGEENWGGTTWTTSRLLRKFPNPKKPNGVLASMDGTTIKFYDGETGTLTLAQWCSNCHEANYGLHTWGKLTKDGTDTRYGHDVSPAGFTTDTSGWAQVIPTDTVNKGPKCPQCHSGRKALQEYQAQGMTKSFPHAGGSSWKMLGASDTPVSIETTTLDRLCATQPCHNATDLP